MIACLAGRKENWKVSKWERILGRWLHSRNVALVRWGKPNKQIICEAWSNYFALATHSFSSQQAF